MKSGALDCWRMFNDARIAVPAYSKFLTRQARVNAESNFSDRESWASIPIMDKRSYLQSYPLPELFPHGLIGALGHASSGSSGKRTFWFRGPKQTAIGATIYGRIVHDAFKLKDNARTLVIIAFSMGVWIAGTYTLLAFERIAESNTSVSLLSPGIEVDDICSILAEIAPHFDNVVVAGYPAFLDLLFSQIERQQLPLPCNLFLLTSGDKSTEEWRDRMVTQLRLAGPDSIINVYGCSDAGILGFESPLTIAIRRQARNNASLKGKLFPGSQDELPGLFQFDPALIYFEQIDGELIFSADLDQPLIRYNIHDLGSVFTLEQMRTLVPDVDAQAIQKWPFPFVTVGGRPDVAAVFFGLKIYPENILAGINDPAVCTFLSGSFLVLSDDASVPEQRLKLGFELASGQGPLSEDQQHLIRGRIRWHIVSTNIEYRKLDSTLEPGIATPSIQFYRNGDLSPSALKGSSHSTVFLFQQGRKPQRIQ
jgi:phenylacetate-CoA ligase